MTSQLYWCASWTRKYSYWTVKNSACNTCRTSIPWTFVYQRIQIDTSNHSSLRTVRILTNAPCDNRSLIWSDMKNANAPRGNEPEKQTSFHIHRQIIARSLPISRAITDLNPWRYLRDWDLCFDWLLRNRKTNLFVVRLLLSRRNGRSLDDSGLSPSWVLHFRLWVWHENKTSWVKTRQTLC